MHHAAFATHLPNHQVFDTYSVQPRHCVGCVVVMFLVRNRHTPDSSNVVCNVFPSFSKPVLAENNVGVNVNVPICCYRVNSLLPRACSGAMQILNDFDIWVFLEKLQGAVDASAVYDKKPVDGY